MPISHLFENFDRVELLEPAVEEPNPQIMPSSELLEQVRKEAFAEGYLAGQADAAKEAERLQAEQTDKIGQQLEDIGFTLVEAEQRVLHRLGPSLSEAATYLIPGIYRDALPLHISALIQDLLSDAAHLSIHLKASEDLTPLLQAALDGREVCIELHEDRTLQNGQIIIARDQEELIELGAVMESVREAFQGFIEGELARSKAVPSKKENHNE